VCPVEISSFATSTNAASRSEKFSLRAALLLVRH
jgi:hypothetical protein